jgi:hypothetical protein
LRVTFSPRWLRTPMRTSSVANADDESRSESRLSRYGPACLGSDLMKLIRERLLETANPYKLLCFPRFGEELQLAEQ